MKILLIIEDNYILGSNLRLNISETLIINKALREFAKNSEYNEDDRVAALRMSEEIAYRLDEEM